eukprot:GABV01000647.1.p2 GENE.GABV01000647.1~~GABV01000647.1.p2  ORF type:complete len:199 (-),score=57.53 GABV01000647.1:54-650(-)
MLGAHYDCRAEDIQDPETRAPGADDNGSGTVSILEIARILKESNLKFKYTVRLALWSGEEQGLVGSRAYAKWAKEEGLDIRAYLNIDMDGYHPDGTDDYVGLKDQYVAPWVNDVIMDVTKVYYDGQVETGFSPSCCSDNMGFHEQGFDTGAFFESQYTASHNPNYHKESDTPDTVSPALMKTISGSMIGTLAEIAELN